MKILAKLKRLQTCLLKGENRSFRFPLRFKKNFLLSGNWLTGYCVLVGLLLSNIIVAQAAFDPHTNCVNGCTAKDIKKITAALVYPTAPNDQLPSNFSCNNGEPVNVKLAVYLTTSTQKAGIYVYANIRNSTTNALIMNVSECFSSGALTSVNGATKVVFNQLITWSCGTGIKLTDVYVGWGTGTDDSARVVHCHVVLPLHQNAMQ